VIRRVVAAAAAAAAAVTLETREIVSRSRLIEASRRKTSATTGSREIIPGHSAKLTG